GAAPKPAPSYATLKLQELQDLAEKDPAQSLEACAALLGDGSSSDDGGVQAPSPDDIKSLASTAESRVYAQYRTDLDAKDWLAAERDFATLRALAGEPSLSPLLSSEAADEAGKGGARAAELKASEAEASFSAGFAAAGLELYLEALDMGRSSDPRLGSDEILKWSARAVAARDRPAAQAIAALASARGMPAPAGTTELLGSKDSISDMRKGVVTIDVDRGIKIEQGYGTPDRVLGSGFYIDRAGYLLTNYHVISSEVDPKYRGFSRITVRPSDAPELRLPAKVVGWDRLLDLALLKVSTTPDYVFSISRKEPPSPGQKIIAIGSPAGLENTVTSGIVSAVGRRLLATGEVFQVDAALNPGNSGGPLVDDSGEVQGIAFAGIPQFQGLNFAIPSTWILKVLPALFRGGEVKRAWLGLALAEDRAAPNDSVGDRLEVTYRHPLMADGIEEGDFIDAIDGQQLRHLPEAQAVMLTRQSDSLALVTVRSGSVTRTLLRYLGERPYAPIESAVAMDRKDKLFPVLYGMSVSSLPGSLLGRSSYMISKVWPGSIADESGLSVNDPFDLRGFYVDDSARAAFIQIHVKKRKAGFLESVIQLGATIDDPSFI
ncbi:MAG TPA: trypsin-like peptidase domain-containing protein, partial [Rectinemataceae bacterium]|nr:trypsin-like peptidase domain-containing protein [Rectinemataceae bacterium]